MDYREFNEAIKSIATTSLELKYQERLAAAKLAKAQENLRKIEEKRTHNYNNLTLLNQKAYEAGLFKFTLGDVLDEYVAMGYVQKQDVKIKVIIMGGLDGTFSNTQQLFQEAKSSKNLQDKLSKGLLFYITFLNDNKDIFRGSFQMMPDDKLSDGSPIKQHVSTQKSEEYHNTTHLIFKGNPRNLIVNFNPSEFPFCINDYDIQNVTRNLIKNQQQTKELYTPVPATQNKNREPNS